MASDSSAYGYVILGILYVAGFIIIGSYMVLRQRRMEKKDKRSKKESEVVAPNFDSGLLSSSETAGGAVRRKAPKSPQDGSGEKVEVAEEEEEKQQIGTDKKGV